DLYGGPYCSTQVVPPSLVLKRRPVAVVTVACEASVASIATRSIDSGNSMRRQWVASVVSNTRPPAPASQHTRAAGAAPARPATSTPSACGCDVAPPSSVRSTAPSTIRHCDSRVGDAISSGAAFLARVSSLAAYDRAASPPTRAPAEAA